MRAGRVTMRAFATPVTRFFGRSTNGPTRTDIYPIGKNQLAQRLDDHLRRGYARGATV
jgi:hypothetical protein